MIDGDSLVLADRAQVRIIGINAPEHDMPLGRRAKEELRRMINKRVVHLQLGKEPRNQHGRILAHAYDAQGNNLAESMLARGYAFHVVVAPNEAQADCYAAAEQEARAARKGIWARPVYAPQDVGTFKLKPGFVRLRGKIGAVKHTRAGSELQFAADLSVRVFIPAAYVSKFGGRAKLSAMQDLIVRGWLSSRNNGYSMTITHPFMVEYRSEETKQ